MANRLYLTATEERSGKSAVLLGVMQMILKEVGRTAIFRPIINDHVFGRTDHDINLVLKHFNLDIPYEDTHAYTLSEARQLITTGQEEQLYSNILKNSSSWKQTTISSSAKVRIFSARIRVLNSTSMPISPPT